MKREWSRRDLLKSAATGVLGAGVGAAVLDRMGRYIVGAKEGGAATAAASISDVQHGRIDLTEHTSMTLVCGVYSEARREALHAREDVAFVQPDRTLTYVSGPNGETGVADDGAEVADGGAGVADSRTAVADGQTVASDSQQAATDSQTQVADGQTLPWGVDRVDADVAHAEGATGAGVDVAVVDGGIDDAHPDLEGNLADPGVEGNHESWVECRSEDCNYPWSDEGDHGTHVAGTVAAADGEGGVVGVAPAATLHALKVCDAAGACRTSAVVEAVRYAADRGWDVVNLSLGTPGESPALRAAGRYALEAGVLPVAAAGNRGRPDSVGYPAAYDEFLAVSATDIEDGIARFSSTGPEVDVAAPGKDVCSAAVGGYRVLEGTSMAAPHVAGAAAQLVADGRSIGDARDRLLDAAEDLGVDESEQGAGLVDVAAALGYDSSDDGTGDGASCPTPT